MLYAARSVSAAQRLAATLLLAGCVAAPAKSASELPTGLVTNFELDGEPFCFVGANNYYLSYKPKPMVDDVLYAAQAMGVSVLRIWGFIDRGSLDGSVRSIDSDGSKDGVYFQAWDPAKQSVLYNDGPGGLQELDYALAKAGKLGIKVVLVLTNNWREFGGMDQYLTWYGLSSHGDFYTAAPVRQAFRDWVFHLATRVNRLTGKQYRADPTIFAWELANEPRAAWGTESRVITGWASEMSSYLKSVDPNHLIAVGDEGFFTGKGDHWTYHAENGVDHAELTALSNIDYGTFHMYPQDWGTGFGWAERWIDDHLELARALRKPTVLEEYGMTVTRDSLGRVDDGLDARLSSYAEWNQRILAQGGSAAMFWMLAGRDSEHGGVYPDFDHFTVYGGDSTSRLLSRFAQRFRSAAPACEHGSRTTSSEGSPFVRVRRTPRL